MAACNVNLMCEDCTFADSYGRGCSYNLLLPVLLVVEGKKCGFFKPKTREQVLEQIRENELRKK